MQVVSLHWKYENAPKIAICFFGLTRKLDLTIGTINAVIAKLKLFCDVTIFLHTYNLSHIRNKSWSGNETAPLRIFEWQDLKPHFAISTDQTDFDLSADFEQYTSNGDAWNDNFASMRNLIRQLNSLKIVTDMWRSNEIDFDAVIYLRPDMQYEAFDGLQSAVEDVIKNPTAIYVPAWPTSLPPNWINDRFSICGKFSAIAYGTRLEYAELYSKQKALHAEQLLHFVLKKQKNKYDVKAMCWFARRLRANGKVFWKDNNLNLEKCLPKV